MESQNHSFEIVRVIGECRLIDEKSFERVYWRRNGKPLAVGYYAVSWPPGRTARRFNEDAVFRGPYKRPEEARAALEQAEARVGARSTPGAPRASVASAARGTGR